MPACHGMHLTSLHVPCQDSPADRPSAQQAKDWLSSHCLAVPAEDPSIGQQMAQTQGSWKPMALPAWGFPRRPSEARYPMPAVASYAKHQPSLCMAPLQHMQTKPFDAHQCRDKAPNGAQQQPAEVAEVQQPEVQQAELHTQGAQQQPSRGQQQPSHAQRQPSHGQQQPSHAQQQPSQGQQQPSDERQQPPIWEQVPPLRHQQASLEQQDSINEQPAPKAHPQDDTPQLDSRHLPQQQQSLDQQPCCRPQQGHQIDESVLEWCSRAQLLLPQASADQHEGMPGLAAVHSAATLRLQQSLVSLSAYKGMCIQQLLFCSVCNGSGRGRGVLV